MNQEGPLAGHVLLVLFTKNSRGAFMATWKTMRCINLYNYFFYQLDSRNKTYFILSFKYARDEQTPGLSLDPMMAINQFRYYSF